MRQEKFLLLGEAGKPRQVLDTQRLQEEHKGIYLQYLTEREGGRVFLVK